MTTPYVDPNTVHNPTAGQKPPASWGDTVRDDLQFFAATPGAQAYRTSNLSVSSGTAAVITLPSENWDTDGFHSTSSNTSRLTIPSGMGGKYMVTGWVVFDGTAGGTERAAYLQVNGSGVVHGSTDRRTAGDTSPTCVIHTELSLSATNYVELMAYHDAGTTLNVGGAMLTIRWVSL